MMVVYLWTWGGVCVVGDMGWSVSDGSILEPQAHVEEVVVLSKVTTPPSVIDLEHFCLCDIFNR